MAGVIGMCLADLPALGEHDLTAMGMMAARVRFPRAVPDLSELRAAVRELLGHRVDLVGLRAEGRDIIINLGLNRVWFAYTMRALTERGGVLVDDETGDPSTYACPDYTRKPWLEYAHSERVAIDDRENAAVAFAPSWRRLRPRCLDVLQREADIALLENDLARILGPAMTLAQLERSPKAVQRRALTHLVDVICNATEPLSVEFARSCLWAIPYHVFREHVDEARVSLDFTDPGQARCFLEMLCVVAPFDAYSLAVDWAEDASSGARTLAVELLAEADADEEPG